MSEAEAGARARNILFLCTGNSARSILAEALANRLGQGRLKAWSAGSRPVGRVNPHALALLARKGFAIDGYESKSWDVFARPDAPEMDMVITVCDSAAGESCPVWPGAPVTAHWGIPDPAAVSGSEAEIARAFALAFDHLQARIEALLTLPFESMDARTLASQLVEIGRAHAAREADRAEDAQEMENTDEDGG